MTDTAKSPTRSGMSLDELSAARSALFDEGRKDAVERQHQRAELLEQHYARTTPLRAASGFGIDDIIDPAETRKKIAMVLSTNQQRRSLSLPPKRHSVEPF
jgi:acetyl-CoA carboxylase carboxyltransferase component